MRDDELETEMRRCLRLLAKGAGALLTFRGLDGVVLRDSHVEPSSGASTAGTTSSHRSVTALADACRVLMAERDHDEQASELQGALVEIWDAAYAPPLRLGPETVPTDAPVAEDAPSDVLGPLSGLRTSEANDINSFTDAHLALALAHAGTPWLPVADTESAAAHRAAGALAASLREAIESDDQLRGRVVEEDPGHDFITFWMVRGADVSGVLPGSAAAAWPPALANRVLDDLLKQIGWHAAGADGRFDPAELAFGLALLQRLAPDQLRPLAARCISVLRETQTVDGAWTTSRLISPGGKRLLHVASYEVALAIAHWLDLQPDEDADDDVTEQCIGMLRNTFRLAETSFTSEAQETDSRSPRGLGRQGWSNDRTRGQGTVESWATALVVTFLTRYHDLLQKRLQRQLLGRYEVQFPRGTRTSTGEHPIWPDFTRSYRRPDKNLATGLASALDADISDPTDSGLLAQEITRHLLEPVLRSPVSRPAKNQVSFLLPGPPGSRKTSLVRAMARQLGWPVVTLSPPTFLLNGLDGFESRAARVFTDLNRMRRVVIFFDECEELFRSRSAGGDGAAPTARTAGAFITAGMLPRLQALHDGGWIIFAMATNAAVDELDPAVIRPGRFDYQVPLGYPGHEAQVRYLRRRLDLDAQSNRLPETLEGALDAHAARKAREGRTLEGIPWSVLDSLAAWWPSSTGPRTRDDIAAVLAAADHAAPPVLGAVEQR